MISRPQPAEEGLLSWVERWAPAEAEIWTRWRRSLSAPVRRNALLPLQAAMAGLMAFRHPENQPAVSGVTDFRPHLHAMRASAAWALDLVRELGGDNPPAPRMRPIGAVQGEPHASLEALARSLTDALGVSERLLELPRIDLGAFGASYDLFLRDLSRNTYFRPSDPLEFANVSELIGPDRLSAHLAAWRADAARATTIVAFLALLRSHRYLGIADQQIRDDDGIYRAHVVLAGTRRELRTLARFLATQGGELLEPLASELGDALGEGLDDGLPPIGGTRGLAAPSERLRNRIRELRSIVKSAAKQLRAPAEAPAPVERESQRVQSSLEQDVWAFRFILRGFLAKASAASQRIRQANATEDFGFACEFVRHFRVFAPRLAKGTGYTRRGPLTRAVSALSRRDEIDAERLDVAFRECELFVEHLDHALEQRDDSSRIAFDKRRAAAELRGYLSVARDRFTSGPPPTGTFGLHDPDHAEAG
jgi:hypothetical protein